MSRTLANDPSDQAIADIKAGRVDTVLFDMSRRFGDVIVDFRACEMVDLSREDGIYGILSHDLQNLVGVTKDPYYLQKNYPVQVPSGMDSADVEVLEQESLPQSLRKL